MIWYGMVWYDTIQHRTYNYIYIYDIEYNRSRQNHRKKRIEFARKTWRKEREILHCFFAVIRFFSMYIYIYIYVYIFKTVGSNCFHQFSNLFHHFGKVSSAVFLTYLPVSSFYHWF